MSFLCVSGFTPTPRREDVTSHENGFHAMNIRFLDAAEKGHAIAPGAFDAFSLYHF